MARIIKLTESDLNRLVKRVKFSRRMSQVDNNVEELMLHLSKRKDFCFDPEKTWDNIKKLATIKLNSNFFRDDKSDYDFEFDDEIEDYLEKEYRERFMELVNDKCS
jgi:hypothetical protein